MGGGGGGGVGATGAPDRAELERERTERRAREQTGRIDAQEQLIKHLRQELHELRGRTTDISSTAHRGMRPSSQEARSRARQAQKLLDAENALAQNKVLGVEKERLDELAQVLRSKLAETELQLEEANGSKHKLQRQLQTAKRQMG